MKDAIYENSWNPQVNPLDTADLRVAAEGEFDARALGQGLALTVDTDDDLDSDGDGVSDAYEIFWESCAYPTTSTEYSNDERCLNVADVSDSDGDGLSDYAEIRQLGTLPYLVDTDGDSITDTLEVAGFMYNGQQWYLGPLEADTNNDGLHDGMECFAWAAGNEDGDTSAICDDTDGDGVPNLFDTDNDNDGVLDRDDESPDFAGDVYDMESPLELTIEGLQTDRPVTVDFQIRPLDADLLNYRGHILDWPSGDYDGQLTRGMTTTFATTDLTDAASTEANASYGDMRIIPILQVTMPYSEGHYANLPVNDTYYGTDRTLETGASVPITVGQWLDATEIDGYGISIADDDAENIDGSNSELVVDVHTYDTAAVTDKGNWLIGANYGTQNHFEGYLDELYVYEVALSQADVDELYADTLPSIRFEFDEESDELNFVDSISGYVAEPISTECTELSLETLTVQELDDTLTNLSIHVGETIYYGSVEDFGAVVTGTTAVSLTLNIDTPICATSGITMTGVYSDGTVVTFSNSATADVVESGTSDVVFRSGSQQVTLAYGTGEVFGLNTPIAGTDGRIGNTLYFPGFGDGYLNVLNSEGLGDFATGDFTIMTWVKTDVGENNPIFSKGNLDSTNDTGEKIISIDDSGAVQLIGRADSGSVKLKSTRVVTDNIWHHVVVTWNYDGSGTGGTGAIYVDGVDVTDSANSDYSAADPDNSGDSWQIGRRDTGSGARYFDGQLDEFTAYFGRALDSTAVYETYLQEARWYRDRGVFDVLVDTDAPTMTIQTTHKYIDTGFSTIVMTPEDPTSSVVLVQYGVQGPLDSSYVWDTAELCTDSTVVYCPVLYADQEGSYDVVYRLVDQVGNETISAIDTYIVDETPLVIGGLGSTSADPVRVASVPNFDTRMTAAALLDLSVQLTQTSEIGWLVSFGGTVADPSSSAGDPGSGIDEDAFYVTIYNSVGDIVGVAHQPATVDASAGVWGIDYEMSTYAPAGTYEVEVWARDLSGNEVTVIIGSFTTDAQEPFVKLAHGLLGTQLISDTYVISGMVSDQAYYALPELQLPFEEGDSAAAFYNYGSDPGLLDCSGASCPQTTANGAFGRGLDFDGTTGWALDSAVISDVIDYGASQDFTIAFWAQADSPQATLTQATNVLVEKWGDGSRYPYSIQYHNQAGGNQGVITASRFDGTNTTVVSSTATLSDGAYHHIALVHLDGDLILYVDGAEQMSVTDVVSDTTANDGRLALGYRVNSSDYNFSGVIDELVMYDEGLQSIAIYSLAQRDVVHGSNSVEVATELIDFATFLDSVFDIDEREDEVSWQAAMLDQAAGLGSAWQYTLTEAEDFYFVHVRAEDAGGNEAVPYTMWHGLIDHRAPRITASAEQVGWGPLIETVYTFTMVDKVLDEETAVYPCANPDITTLSYSDSDLPHDGMIYQISGTCTVEDQWQTSGTFEICDVAGHCSQEVVTPSTSTDLGGIRIVTPTVALTTTEAGVAIEIAGSAVADSGVQTVTVAVDGTTVETIAVGGSVTETAWSTLSWTPAVTGTHVISAWVTDSNGQSYVDQLTLDLADLSSTELLTVTSLAVSGTDLIFDWAATSGLSGCDVYVYQSTADPYAGFAQWLELTVSPQTVTPSGESVVFYYLGTTNCGETAVSETVGVFQFELEPGD